MRAQRRGQIGNRLPELRDTGETKIMLIIRMSSSWVTLGVRKLRLYRVTHALAIEQFQGGE